MASEEFFELKNLAVKELCKVTFIQTSRQATGCEAIWSIDKNRVQVQELMQYETKLLPQARITSGTKHHLCFGTCPNSLHESIINKQ